MEKIKTLGLYDSGLGGYSVFSSLRETLPSLNLVLYADQKNAPYGNRSDSEIIELSKSAMRWFESQGIDHVLIACNTVSAVALKDIQESFSELHIYGIIDLTLSQVNTESVGVISTLATFNSKAYRRPLEELGLRVVDKATVPLVELIETMQDPKEYLESALVDFQTVDALILACTHYPLVIDTIKDFFKGDILDSRKPIHTYFVEKVHDNQCPTYRCVTTGKPEIMKKQIEKLFGIQEEVEGVL